MKYTNDEALREILNRSVQITRRKYRRELQLLSTAVTFLSALLLFAIFSVPKTLVGISPESVYGAFLLGPEAGGYVFVAFIAFVLGVTVVLLCQRIRDVHSRKDEKEGEAL